MFYRWTSTTPCRSRTDFTVQEPTSWRFGDDQFCTYSSIRTISSFIARRPPHSWYALLVLPSLSDRRCCWRVHVGSWDTKLDGRDSISAMARNMANDCWKYCELVNHLESWNSQAVTPHLKSVRVFGFTRSWTPSRLGRFKELSARKDWESCLYHYKYV